MALSLFANPGALSNLGLQRHVRRAPAPLLSSLCQGHHEDVSCSYSVVPQRQSQSHALRHATRGMVVLAKSMNFPNPGDPYANLLKSPIFQNPVIVKEFHFMVDDLMSLSRMSSKFPDFDTTGKRMYIDRMRDATERYELFIKRLEMSEDPAAREYLRSTNAQMLNGGFTLRQMFEGFKASMIDYEKWVVREEAALAAGPEKHQEFLKAIRAAWQQTSLGAMDLGALASTITPEMMSEAQADPQFWACIREISDAPTSQVLSKWMSHPKLGPLVAEMARSMLNMQAKRAAQQ